MRLNFKATLWRGVLLLLALAWTAPQASADVTVFVQASSAPKLYVFNTSGTCSGTNSGTAFSNYTTWSGVTMSKSVTTSDNKTWYYEVFTGLNSCSIILNNGSSQTDDITSVSGTKYYYYNGTTRYIDLTNCKSAQAYCFLETSTTYWEKDGARFQVWDGSANVWMTQVGSVRNGGKIYLYTKSSTVNDNTTFYFKRMSSDGNSQWNEGSASYHKGGYYTNTGWSNVSYQSGSSLGSIVWPTIPASPTLSYTLHVYDPDGAPKVNGTTLTTTTNGTNCTWYTYTATGTTLPSSITLTNHGGTKSQTLTPSNATTDYRAFNGYSIQTVTADYDPAVRHLIHWPEGNQYANGTDLTTTTTDGINYTYANITVNGNDWLVFTTSYTGDWNTDSGHFYGAGGNVTVSGNSGNGTGTKGQTGIINVTTAGIWSFSYNIITNAWTATKTGDLPTNTFTIHVIDYNGSEPYLYAWGSNISPNNAFPGAVPANTETSAAGETWYVQSFTSTAATISAIVSLGGSDTQTTDITGIAPGDYYIVYNSQTKTYTGSTTCPEGKVQAQKNVFTVYVLADPAPYIYLWDDNNQAIGNTWPGTLMNTTEQLADGNNWWKIEVETWDEDLNLLFHDGDGHQTGDITQTEAVAYYVYDGATEYVKTVEPTGQMYVIGTVGGNPWAANTGQAMTAASDGTTFTLNNVQIIAGATFAFATRLGSTEDDWNTLQQYRLTSTAEGDFWLVKSDMTDKDNPTSLSLQPWNTADKNFKMDETAYYDITVDLRSMTATIKRASDALYMYYGSHWAPNAGVPMITTDGENYTLSNVTLADGGTFQFTKTLGSNANTWPANDQRFGANAVGEWWTVTTDELNITLQDALQQGSTKDFKMDSGTAGTYRVVVNPSAGTVALYSMATVLDGVTIIHLEKTKDVASPVLWAYDKETLASTGERIHEDRPDRKDIYDTRVKLTPAVLDEITTADGRTWWSWEVDNSITDFWFTREPYHYDGSNATSTDMTDIQWRKSGELYFTWPAETSTLDEYTRDYYAAAAQESAGCAVMIEGHRYAYFTNTPGWDNVFCHAWWTDDNGENHDLLTPPTSPDGLNTPRYPGALCELVGYDKDGYEVWRIDLTAAGITTYPNGGILFNNGIDKPTADGSKWDYFTGEEATIDKEQTGDFAYSTGTCYDYCGVIVLGRSLGNIIRNGIVDGPVYTIEEDLVAVFFDPNAETQVDVDGTTHTMYGALYCKDLNKFVSTANVEKSLQKEGQVDYMHNYFFTNSNSNAIVPDRYDQSNWVRLTLSTQYPDFEYYQANYMGNKNAQLAALSGYVGKVLKAETVNGQLVDNYNPEMRLAYHALPAEGNCPTGSFTPNVYLPTSLLGNQKAKDSNDNDIDFFFVTPKPLELSMITWAVYGGNDEFFVCDKSQYDYRNGTMFYINPFDLKGYFKAEWELMDKPTLQEGQLYEFYVITPLNESLSGTQSGAPRNKVTVIPKTDRPESPYSVLPVLINDNDIVITAVNDVKEHTFKHATSVQYVDVTGRVSNRPFAGVNIVVTRYDDGTTSTNKVIYSE